MVLEEVPGLYRIIGRTNFNVYDLDTVTGEYRVVREGHLDQPGA